jgi:L,D-transpeptidase ErfK/SrfK
MELSLAMAPSRLFSYFKTTASVLTVVFAMAPAMAQTDSPTGANLRPLPVSTMNDWSVASLPLGPAADYLPQPAKQRVSHLVLKLSERTLYLYNQRQELHQFPVAVGRTGWETPTGRFAVMNKVEHPAWEHPLTGEIVPAGGDNPLGERWIGFWTDGVNAIGFHGTPQEELIGQAVSHGCVRLRNADVVALYELVDVGTAVYVVP